jgi:hypothetical protein
MVCGVDKNKDIFKKLGSCKTFKNGVKNCTCKEMGVVTRAIKNVVNKKTHLKKI